MIVIGYFGGLASQMNQYAFMCELKRRFPNATIKGAMADSWLHDGQHNGFELNKVFGIAIEEASKSKIIKLADFYPGNGFFAKICSKILFYRRKILGKKKTQVTIDDPTIFYPEIFNIDLKKDIFFWGNWCAEEYFELSRERIIESFKFKNPLDSVNEELLNQISSCNSISIHVRHGDYKKYGFSILPIEYYKSAVQTINERVDNPVYFIFSDDKEYIEYAFDFIENPVIVTNNQGEDSYKDMQLMSLCKHNIIANSGFSFWGAWLNSNPKKIVIAPDKHVPWCQNPIALHDWIKIKV